MKKLNKTYRGRNTVLIKSGLIIFWGLFLFFLLINLMPTNVASINADRRENMLVSNLLPEGWAFFTKSPRQYITYIYGYNEKTDQWQMIPISSLWGSYLGTSKKRTRLNMQIAQLMHKTSRDQWEKSNNLRVKPTLPDSLVADGRIYAIKKDASVSLFYDRVLIIRKKILPWAWRVLKDSFTMPVHYIKVNVVGSGK